MAAIVKTTDDVWTKLRVHHVEATSSAVKPWLLVDGRARFGAIEAFAKAASRDLASDVIALEAQTSADAYSLWHFRCAERVRFLVYARDHGGWVTDEGETQDWEHAFFFDPRGSTSNDDDGARWPDNLGDELSADDLAAYEAAKTSGDARSILHLLRPSSLAPFTRLCQHFDLELQKPGAVWNPPKRGFLARLLA